MEKYRKAEWGRDLRGLFDKYGIPENAVENFGDPLAIIRAEDLILKRPRGFKVDWVGGGMRDKPFYVTLEAPSYSGRHEPYLFAYKFDTRKKYVPFAPANQLEIIDAPSHDCAYKLYEIELGGGLSPCIHEIAGRMFLERNMHRISKEYFEDKGMDEVFRLQRKYRKYDNLDLFFVLPKYPADVMDFFWRIEREGCDSITERDLLYSYLKNRESPTRGDTPEYRKWYSYGVV